MVNVSAKGNSSGCKYIYLYIYIYIYYSLEMCVELSDRFFPQASMRTIYATVGTYGHVKDAILASRGLRLQFHGCP